MTDQTASATLARTSEGLKDALFDEIQALRDGRGSEKRCNAIARAAKTIVDVTSLEMEMFEFRARHDELLVEQNMQTQSKSSIKRKGKQALDTVIKLGSCVDHD